jgi:hypothetical protein
MMKTATYLKISLFILLLEVVLSAGATSNNPSCKKWIQPFQTTMSGSLPTTRFIQNKLRSATALKQRLDSMVIYSKDTLGLKAGGESMIQFEYNSFGQLTYQCVSSLSYETNVLEPTESLVFVYDSKGLMSSDSSYLWDTEKRQWIRRGFDEYAYDSEGRLIMKVEAFENLSTDYEKTTYLYDESGKLLNETEYDREAFNTWEYEGKMDYSYLTNGLLAVKTEYTWDTSDKSWSFTEKTESNYDNKGKDTLTATYTWNGATNTWMNWNKVECQFDNNGNMLREDFYEWDEDSLFWTGYTSSTYEYDLNIRNDELVMPFQLNSFPIYNKLIGGAINIWIDMSRSWLPIMDVSCYYSNMNVMGLSKPTNAKSTWSFNSKTNVLSLDATNIPSTLYLYDLQGRKVASYRNLNATSLSLHHLKKGMYLIVLGSNGSMEQGKLVVE